MWRPTQAFPAPIMPITRAVPKQSKLAALHRPAARTSPSRPAERDVEKIAEALRAALRSRGAVGIFGLARNFKICDTDGSRKLDRDELGKCLRLCKLQLSATEFDTLFAFCDADRSGLVDYNEFLRAVRGRLPPLRRKLVVSVFNAIDQRPRKGGEGRSDGVLTVDDLRQFYSAKDHPEVKAGTRSESAILTEMIKNFEGSKGNRDGKVTLAEWIDYYEELSASIDSDDYFSAMITEAWGTVMDGAESAHNPPVEASQAAPPAFDAKRKWRSSLVALNVANTAYKAPPKPSSRWRQGALMDGASGWPASEGTTVTHRGIVDQWAPNETMESADPASPDASPPSVIWTARYPAWWPSEPPEAPKPVAAAQKAGGATTAARRPEAARPAARPVDVEDDVPGASYSEHTVSPPPPPPETKTIATQTAVKTKGNKPKRSPMMPCMRQAAPAPETRSVGAPATSKVGLALRREAALKKQLDGARRRRLEAIVSGQDPDEAPIVPTTTRERALVAAPGSSARTTTAAEQQRLQDAGLDEAEAALVIAQRFLGSSIGGYFTDTAAGSQQPRPFDLSETPKSYAPAAGGRGTAGVRVTAAAAGAAASMVDDAPYVTEETELILAVPRSPVKAEPDGMSAPRSLDAVESAVSRYGLHDADDPIEVRQMRAAAAAGVARAFEQDETPRPQSYDPAYDPVPAPVPPRKEAAAAEYPMVMSTVPPDTFEEPAWRPAATATTSRSTCAATSCGPHLAESGSAVRNTAWEIDISELRKPASPTKEDAEMREAEQRARERSEGLRPKPGAREGRRSHSGWMAEFVM